MTIYQNTATGERVDPGDVFSEAARLALSPDWEPLAAHTNSGAPNESALKSEWSAYAVARGVSQQDADDATKQELIEQFEG